jgi:hypothetical protein
VTRRTSPQTAAISSGTALTSVLISRISASTVRTCAPTSVTCATHQQGLTPTVMANNAAQETKKAPATKVVHQA